MPLCARRIIHFQNDSPKGIYQENLRKTGGSGGPVNERAAIHGFLDGRLGNGNIPDSQNRKTTSSRNKRQEKEGGQKF